MNIQDTFNIEQVIAMVEVKLESASNSCEYEFYLELKEELTNLLRK